MTPTLRFAGPDDAPAIHRLIRALAAYEKEPDAVEATPESLRAQLQERPPPFECLLAEEGGAAVGFALFLHNYSTWRGRRGLYLEDLFVLPEHRGRGAGAALVRALARLALERGCARLDFAVLDWNRPSLEFFARLGAVPLPEWRLHRLDGEALAALAAG